MRASALAALLLAACSPEPRRAFPVGILAPSARVAEAARRLGLDAAERAPAGAAAESGGALVQAGDDASRVADRARLRWLAARAAATGASGIYFQLPSVPAGFDLLDYPEEWQAIARAGSEALAMRPVIERGEAVPSPLPAGGGLVSRAWAFQGRRYAVLVNESASPAPIDEGGLAGWRALFAARSDAREALAPCEAGKCLPAEGALWLEGDLRAGGAP